MIAKILRGPVGAWGVSVAVVAVALEFVDLPGIVLEIPPHLREGVSSEFLQKSVRQYKCDHGFTSDGAGGDHAPIAALIGGLHGLLGNHVGRLKRRSHSGE